MRYGEKICLDEFAFIAGNSFDIVITMMDDAGLPIDLTDYTSVMKIAQFGNIRTTINTITGVIDIPNSKITYSLTDTLTSTLSGKYVYQPISTHISGTKIVPKQGTFLVVKEIG